MSKEQQYLPLLSEFGRAVEAGSTPQEPDGRLQKAKSALEEARDTDMMALVNCINLAEFVQLLKYRETSPEVSRSDPGHPLQRLARIQIMKALLWPGDYERGLLFRTQDKDISSARDALLKTITPEENVPMSPADLGFDELSAA